MQSAIGTQWAMYLASVAFTMLLVVSNVLLALEWKGARPRLGREAQRRARIRDWLATGAGFLLVGWLMTSAFTSSAAEFVKELFFHWTLRTERKWGFILVIALMAGILLQSTALWLWRHYGPAGDDDERDERG